jgi:hypothetical protein
MDGELRMEPHGGVPAHHLRRADDAGQAASGIAWRGEYEYVGHKILDAGNSQDGWKQLEAIPVGRPGWRWCARSWTAVWKWARTECWPGLHRADHRDHCAAGLGRAVAGGRWDSVLPGGVGTERRSLTTLTAGHTEWPVGIAWSRSWADPSPGGLESRWTGARPGGWESATPFLRPWGGPAQCRRAKPRRRPRPGLCTTSAPWSAAAA